MKIRFKFLPTFFLYIRVFFHIIYIVPNAAKRAIPKGVTENSLAGYKWHTSSSFSFSPKIISLGLSL